MECDGEKCAMLIMKSRRLQLMEEIEPPNQEKIRTFREKEIDKYSRKLEVDTINYAEMKE